MNWQSADPTTRETEKSIQAPTLHEAAWVGAVAIAAFALRLFMIDYSSLWWDEGFSMWFSRQSLADLFGVISSIEPNPPFYYAALKGWASMFGESDFALRSLSAAFGACTVPLVYLAARWMAPQAVSHRYGLLAAVLFALAFQQLRYAHEARAYTLFVLSLAGALASVVLILRTRLQGRMPSVVPFACLGASTALVVWSHYTGALYVCLLGMFITVWWLAVEHGDRRLFARLCLSGFMCIVLASPSVWALLHLHPLTVNAWIQAPDLRNLAFLVTQDFGADFGATGARTELLARILVFGPWPILGLVATLRPRTGAVRAAGPLMLTLSAGIVALIAAISYLGRPIFLEGPLVPAQLGWVMLCALAPLAFPSHWRPVATTVLVLCFVLGAAAYFKGKGPSSRNEDWRGVAAELRARTPDGLRVLTDADGPILLKHYLQNDPGKSHVPVTGFPQEISVEIGRAQLKTEPPSLAWFGAAIDTEVGAIVTQLSSDQSAWLVLRAPSAKLVDALARNGIVPLFQKERLVAFHTSAEDAIQ